MVVMLILLAFLSVAGRLFHLQVVKGPENRMKAEENHVRLRSLIAPRGQILTSDGMIVAKDSAAYDLVVDPIVLRGSTALRWRITRLFRSTQVGRYARISDVRSKLIAGPDETAVGLEFKAEAKDVWGNKLTDRGSGSVRVPSVMEEVAGLVASVAGVDQMEVLERLVHATVRDAYLAFRDVDAVIIGDLSFPVICKLELAMSQEERRLQLNDRFKRKVRLGVYVKARPDRQYPEGAFAAHLIGHVGKVNAEDLEKWGDSYHGVRSKRLKAIDTVGRTGLERRFDFDLRGQWGEQLVDIDGRHNVQEILREVLSVPGEDVVLTLDAEMQRTAEAELRRLGRPGAVVVMDPEDGAIIAMASYPTFNLDTLTEDYSDLLRNREHPLVNRSVSGGYPAGSVFKIATALAVSESLPGSVDCGGHFRIGRFADNATHGDGVVLEEALKRSCNVYFYEAAYRAETETLLDGLRQLGFGAKTGIELPFEGGGRVPTPDWKAKTKRGQWLLYDKEFLAIGQGDLLVSPLQIARLIALVANDGALVTPHIVRERRTFDGRITQREYPVAPLSLDRTVLSRIREGMRQVVNDYGGTAYKAFKDWQPGYTVAGKTSTAQRKTRGRVDNVGWFAGFAPYESPRVCFAVAIEHLNKDEGGGRIAGPVAREILEVIRKRAE